MSFKITALILTLSASLTFAGVHTGDPAGGGSGRSTAPSKAPELAHVAGKLKLFTRGVSTNFSEIGRGINPTVPKSLTKADMTTLADLFEFSEGAVSAVVGCTEVKPTATPKSNELQALLDRCLTEVVGGTFLDETNPDYSKWDAKVPANILIKETEITMCDKYVHDVFADRKAKLGADKVKADDELVKRWDAAVKVMHITEDSKTRLEAQIAADTLGPKQKEIKALGEAALGSDANACRIALKEETQSDGSRRVVAGPGGSEPKEDGDSDKKDSQGFTKPDPKLSPTFQSGPTAESAKGVDEPKNNGGGGPVAPQPQPVAPTPGFGGFDPGVNAAANPNDFLNSLLPLLLNGLQNQQRDIVPQTVVPPASNTGGTRTENPAPPLPPITPPTLGNNGAGDPSKQPDQQVQQPQVPQTPPLELPPMTQPQQNAQTQPQQPQQPVQQPMPNFVGPQSDRDDSDRRANDAAKTAVEKALQAFGMGLQQGRSQAQPPQGPVQGINAQQLAGLRPPPSMGPRVIRRGLVKPFFRGTTNGPLRIAPPMNFRGSMGGQ